ncbi:hypothetical protein BCR43DRAFT_221296 [Syncephalastrum racemosum]|uniref:Uncharacterized protein n=1 Tax=Syncephalastrum racemosum TaxID=13706 RepID=A0A1X2HJD9_SYNRA|nr:hypothetical protein BCR43DRAFT_221296 [Syncephalastrum racemosum]
MLLKPCQYSKETREHFGATFLVSLHERTRDSLLCEAHDIDAVFAAISDIIYGFQDGKISSKECARRLMAISSQKTKAVEGVLFALAKLVPKLPKNILLESAHFGESEIWSSIFDPISSAVVADVDQDVLLRWCNVKAPENDDAADAARTQPDAIICQLEQLT